MMGYYTKSMFGEELKNKLLQKEDVIEIGIWAHSTYLENCGNLEPGLRQIMLDLNTMELGSEFAISYEMLNKIANDLIIGKAVDLNAEEYRDNNDIYSPLLWLKPPSSRWENLQIYY